MPAVARLRVGVLGATGMVGQRFVSLLQDHPRFDLVAAYASDRSEGRTVSATWRLHDAPLYDGVGELVLREGSLENVRADRLDLVFSALPAAVARDLEGAVAVAGVPVFSNASAHRMERGVPLLIPEVNPEHLGLLDGSGRGFLVTNPNCTTTGLALVLHALGRAVRFRRVFVATYQALSGAGFDGPAGIDVSGNVLPHIQSEEEKVLAESPKILGTMDGGGVVPADLRVYAQCARVPVRDGHLEAVTVECEESPDLAAVERALATFTAIPQARALPTAPTAPILVRTEPDRPQPLLDVNAGTPARARGMAVTVGRLRSDDHVLRLYLLVHNTIRGGAGGSLLNAELADALGYLG